MLANNLHSWSIATIWLKCLGIIWILLNTFRTCMKEKSIPQALSLQAFYGWYINIIVVGMQIASVNIMVRLTYSPLPFSLEQIHDESVSEKFWLTRGLARDFRLMTFLDSICIFLLFLNIIAL